MRKISIKQKVILVILGLFLCLVLLEVGLRLGGFILLSLQEHRNKISLRQKGTYRILCLGESTTAQGGEYSYPRQLEGFLNQSDIGIKFSVINKGLLGINTTAIVAQLENNLNKYTPDMVITMMGVNDNPGTVRYEDSLRVRINLFLKEFRVYKLANAVGMNVLNRFMEIGDSFVPLDLKDLEDILMSSRDQGKLREIEIILTREIEIDPEDSKLYFLLARCYMAQGRYKKVEEMLKKAIEIDPYYTSAYGELGICYSRQGEYDIARSDRGQERYKEAEELFKKAEEILKKAIEIDPYYTTAYTELGICYKNQGEYDKSEKMFKKAIEISPQDFGPHRELGGFYIEQERWEEAEKVLKKGLEIIPPHELLDQKGQFLHLDLELCYRKQGKFKGIDELITRIIESNVKNDCLYGFVATSYRDQGKFEQVERYYHQANKYRLQYYKSVTRHNYWKLKDIITQKGIKLVCVQYPMRAIEPLRKLFDSREGIIFVDNEKVFKQALQQGSYEEYFSDRFGGDFGHCTPKGNRLLAGNIAKVILKECFGKQ